MIISEGDARQKGHITVVLSNSDDKRLKNFICPVCGQIAFSYHDDINVLIAGEIEPESMNRGIDIICKGYMDSHSPNNHTEHPIKCQTKYHIQ